VKAAFSLQNCGSGADGIEISVTYQNGCWRRGELRLIRCSAGWTGRDRAAASQVRHAMSLRMFDSLRSTLVSATHSEGELTRSEL
jgi:hypothetical protein